MISNWTSDDWGFSGKHTDLPVASVFEKDYKVNEERCYYSLAANELGVAHRDTLEPPKLPSTAPEAANSLLHL